MGVGASVGRVVTVVLTLIKCLFCVSVGDADIIDEAIYYFKANIFFRNYEIKVSVWFGSTYWQSLKTEPKSDMRLLVTEPHFFSY